jgi:hypothetical protein
MLRSMMTLKMRRANLRKTRPNQQLTKLKFKPKPKKANNLLSKSKNLSTPKARRLS